MKMSFRWYGPDDPVTLQNIRQIPNMQAIVTAVYDVPVGEVWSRKSIAALKKQTEDNGLQFEVIESVPVHEDIKLGKPTRDRYIGNYCENIRRLAEAGIRCICYNFMPVFDWLRSELEHAQPDGANALAYDDATVRAMDPLKGDLSLPGWDASYTKAELKDLLTAYAALGEEWLWKNLETFLKAVIPVAKEVGVNMAIHPDDPPYPIFGLPRIITCEKNLDRMLSIVDSPANSLTLCTGSLGCASFNDIPHLVRKYAERDRIAFMHIRNVKNFPDGSFEEAGHLSCGGSLDLYAIVKALVDNNYDGYVRPDHGRMIWGETGKPGYGLYDRALGATYLNGLFEACEKAKAESEGK
mgnify:CR=1 FL=1